MGVMIKGMEMPKTCSDCGQFRWSNFLQSDVCRIAEAIGGDGLFKFEDEGIANRPSWCPLTEIPSHGRLIDADALARAVNDFPYGYRGMILAEIAVAPTIIPAEGGDVE